MVEVRLHLEILALLLQVAWADETVELGEAQHILERAKEAGLDDEFVARLDACLQGVATLPPPDLGYLRAHKQAALAAVEHFTGGTRDGDEETRGLVDQVRELLEG